MKNKIGVTAIIISLVSLCCSVVCLCVAFNTISSTAVSASSEASEGSSMQYVMYVGTNDKDTYRLEMTEEEAKNIVDEVCLKYFEGYTLQEATGAWTDEKKNITHEYTLVCYFDGADKETVYKAADELIEKLNQNSVLIEEDKINIEYYSGK
ncbi:MAG: DUF3574 domain-containing protein [Ruminiclostridium sp.]|nr:DUF3574 domain-containing protein [Ruminiclostridium sp.]MBP3856232.1 DUF3574 domain-containing protein [Ruminiclostridium sp.]